MWSINVGERLGMGSTAIGREASRGATYGDGRVGPNREHARAVPFSGITVLVRSPR
jgi:hypothetical protein